MTDEKQLEVLRNNFRKAVGCYRKELFEKKDYGICFTFNRLSMNKIGCIKSVNKSIQNGFTAEEHFKAAENIKDLFECSVLIEQHYKKKTDRCERHNLCVSELSAGVYVYTKVVTWGINEGYIDLYLSKGAE